jgi:glyoxylase-like metal-dependent hydrolase (beta-lactamase superfamily II)
VRLAEDLYAYVWDGYENNCNSYYFGGEVRALIDPGHLRFADGLLGRLRTDGVEPEGVRLVIATHSHPDHMEGITRFLELGVPVAAHAEALAYLGAVGPAMYQWMGAELPPAEGLQVLQEGPVAALGGLVWVYHTPGHEPGSLCVYWPGKRALVTGDLVFAGGVGRTDFPGGDHARLMAGIDRMAGLEVDYLLPGHGPVLDDPRLVERNYRDVRAYRGW